MGKLVCRIELDKTDGMILTVENGDGKITQTIVMNGTSIIATVKGSDATSTITQKQDGVSIDCKTFTLNAESITCKSSGKTHHESGQDFEIDVKNNIQVSAVNAAKYAAMSTTLESKAETKVTGATLAFSGTTNAELKAVNITVDASAALNLKSGGMVDLKGAMVSIKGDGMTAIKGGVLTIN